MTRAIRIAASRPYRMAWAFAELRGGVALPYLGVRDAWMATGGDGRRIVVVPGAGDPAALVVVATALSLRDVATIAACAACPPTYRRLGETREPIAIVEFRVDHATRVRVVPTTDLDGYLVWAATETVSAELNRAA